MEKQTHCAKCGILIVVTGPSSTSREVMQSLTCPACGHPNEVSWPMDMGWKVFVPTQDRP
jgi:DNA-directed RNA polymerase subunit RPC12/RpoP